MRFERCFARWLLLFSALQLAACAEPTSDGDVEMPNLILIVSDDQGYTDFGFMGSPYVQTPHLDRLAREGTVFPNGFVTASYCAPSLRSLLTGLHPLQLHFWLGQRAAQRGPDDLFEPMRDVATLPRVLGARGYASYQGGKFWEGGYESAGFTQGMQGARDKSGMGGVGRMLGRDDGLEPVFEFIDAHKDQPFFLWFAPMLPHMPHDAAEAYRTPYEDRGLSSTAIDYYASITRFDAVVGELLGYLDARGLRDRSLILFLADNGWDQGPHARRPYTARSADAALANAPLELQEALRDAVDGPRGKFTLYELGLRTPIILQWQGRVPAGAVRDELVSAVDLFPTFLDYAGVEPSGDLLGHSLRPLLDGSGAWTREAVIGQSLWVRPNQHRPITKRQREMFETEPAFFLRNDQWHYIWYHNWQTDALYDVALDPDQNNDVSFKNREVVRDLRKQILAWRSEVLSEARSPDARESPLADAEPDRP